MIVYDVTSRESFDSITRWLGEIENHANEKIVLSIVGNKADLTGNERRQNPLILFRTKKGNFPRRNGSCKKE